MGSHWWGPIKVWALHLKPFSESWRPRACACVRIAMLNSRPELKWRRANGKISTAYSLRSKIISLMLPGNLE